MARIGREALQDQAILHLLQALPVERLERILDALGVAPEKVERRKDDRRCSVCGHGYPRCRAIDERAPASERHDWSPAR